MKRILCFGDSNTWGYVSGQKTLTRFDENTRWTALLKKKLASKAEIIEFGLCGCESGECKKNGIPINASATSIYSSVLFASYPVDAVIIMLGSNDVKERNCWKSGYTAENLRKLISSTKLLAPNAQIILASAVYLDSRITIDPEYSARAIEDSHLCAAEVEELAKSENLPFFDTNAWVKEKGIDGCHFTAADHAAFADGMATFLDKLCFQTPAS